MVQTLYRCNIIVCRKIEIKKNVMQHKALSYCYKQIKYLAAEFIRSMYIIIIIIIGIPTIKSKKFRL